MIASHGKGGRVNWDPTVAELNFGYQPKSIAPSFPSTFSCIPGITCPYRSQGGAGQHQGAR